jgi:hypothetical protein
MITYLIGIAAIIGIIAYIYGFNYVRIKYFGDQITDPFDYVLMPFIAIIVVMVICALPMVIGQTVMGYF